MKAQKACRKAAFCRLGLYTHTPLCRARFFPITGSLECQKAGCVLCRGCQQHRSSKTHEYNSAD